MLLSADAIHLMLSVLYALVGVVLLFGAYRLFDILTPTDLQKKVFEEGNVAVAVLTGAFLIALGLVIAAAISG